MEKNSRSDVCVVGAGIAGMTSAYLLAREGKSVVVVDKNGIARGETAYTTAHLSSEIDASYRKIVHLHGERGAQLAAESHSVAISEIESIVTREKIDCDFERLDGYLFLAHGDSDKTLVEEFEATQRAKLDVMHLDGPPFDLKLGPCLRFSRQAQFHPLKYMAGLVRAFKRAGGRLYAKTEAREIKGGKSAKIKTQNGVTISAEAVVVATNTPVNDWVKMHTKQAAYRTYVIGVRVPADSIPKALYWDTEDPFHYVRLQRMADRAKAHDLLIIDERQPIDALHDLSRPPELGFLYSGEMFASPCRETRESVFYVLFLPSFVILSTCGGISGDRLSHANAPITDSGNFREARFWITSGLPTTHPESSLSLQGAAQEYNCAHGCPSPLAPDSDRAKFSHHSAPVVWARFIARWIRGSNAS